MTKLLLVAPAFVFPLVLLISKVFGDRLPKALDFLKISEDDAFRTFIVMAATEHSAVLWTPFMRLALADGRGQGAALILAIAYSLFIACFLVSRFNWGFFLQVLLAGSVFAFRVHEYLTSDRPDLFASYLMMKSAVVLFGGALLGVLVTEMVYRIGRKTPWPKLGEDYIATFIIVMVPISGFVDYWLLGLLESGEIYNAFS